MKKIFIIFILFAFAGCLRADLEIAIYEDLNHEFIIKYPADWTVTTSHDEVQFWNIFQGDHTIKMALFEAKDINFMADDNGSHSEINVPVMVRTGKFMSDFQIYYYDLGNKIIGFSAYYEASTPGHKEQVTQIQESFQAI